MAQDNNVQNFIRESLIKDSLFQNAVGGIIVVNDNEEVVAQWNPDMPLLTASTMKTITTGIGLQILGPDYRYKTTLSYSGEIKDSVLCGNLVIIGSGDPTFGSQDTIATPINEIFATWTKAIKDLGIKEVDGYIVGDDRYFTNEIVPDTWSWDNLGASYGSGTSGLSYNENLQTFTIVPNEEVGEPVIIKNVSPYIPDMDYTITALTQEPGTSSYISYFASDLSKIGFLEGGIAINRDSIVTTKSSKFPDVSAAWELKEYLKKNGIICNDSIPEIETIEPEELTVIAENASCTLMDIVEVTNRISNNFYAETILKTIGKEMTTVGSYDSALVAVSRFLEEKGLDLTGYEQADGSGLSRRNHISPRFFARFYKMMQDYEHFDAYYNSFPVPGKPGTAKNVLKGESDDIKHRIHAKSGSLGGVRCYAGYVDGEEQTYRFAILINNYPVSTSLMQPLIEEFMKTLSIYAATN